MQVVSDGAGLTGDAFEAQLARALASAASPEAGLFGPHSASWRLGREAILFMGAAPTALMQIAHPWVAESTLASGAVQRDPMGRFQRTFAIVYAMMFGTAPAALAAARRLRAIHTRIAGRMSEDIGPYRAGSPYVATEAFSSWWVHATLIWGSVQVFERVIAPLSQAERDAVVADWRVLGWLYGVPDTMIATDWQALERQLEAALADGRLSVGKAAREMAAFLLDRAPYGPLRGAPGVYRTFTAMMLPERLREAFGLGASAREIASMERSLGWLRAGLAALPASLRFVGPYHEAKARYRGRKPGPIERTSTRVLTGRPLIG